jgi:glycosyltransferase involved in cell wall biosynthesis
MTQAEARERRRVLVLTPFPPRLDAAHGGGRATAQLVYGLTAQERVWLLCARGPDEPPVDEALRERCEGVDEIDHPEPRSGPASRWRQRLARARGLAAGRPLWVSESRSADLAARLRQLVAAWRPNLVQLEMHVMAQYLDALRGCPAPRVLTEHEPGVARARDTWRAARGPARLLALADWAAWWCYERAATRRVNAIVTFTERDRQALARLAGRGPIVTIPLGVELPPAPLEPLGQQPPELVFFGSYRHAPNVDAALRLARDILPLARARRPELRLTLIGEEPPTALQALASASVLVPGRVPDLTPYLERAALVVVPLRQGGGMRLKVLEALAAGKAVVASPLAAAGLQLTSGEQAVLADDDDELAQAIERLLADPAERAALAARARAWASANLNWDQTIAAYRALYDRLEARPGTPAALPDSAGEVRLGGGGPQ